MSTPDEILMGLEIVASLDEDAWERYEEAKAQLEGRYLTPKEYVQEIERICQELNI